MNTSNRPTEANEPSAQSLLEAARQVLRSESTSIAAVADHLDGTIVNAMQTILERTGETTHGTVVVSGIGKAGLVGQRISASFASTGTASHFLHPVEATHGDLGRVRRNDVVLLLSYSGESEEVLRLLDLIKRIAVPIIAITSSRQSSLGRLADLTIEMGKVEEVCPHGLAPTSTVNCISAVGDALVLGVMSLRNFTKEDFAASHPSGALGRKLLKVSQVMEFKVGENFTALPEDLKIREILDRDQSTGRRAGAVVLVDSTGRLAGVFTDGDLRRKLKSEPDLLNLTAKDVMTRNPKRIRAEALASEALAILNRHRIDELPVVDDDSRVIGLIDVQDLVRLRIVE